MMVSDPWEIPAAPPPLPRRPPRANVAQILQLLEDEPGAAPVKLLAGGREYWAAGLVKTDPDGNVVIC